MANTYREKSLFTAKVNYDYDDKRCIIIYPYVVSLIYEFIIEFVITLEMIYNVLSEVDPFKSQYVAWNVFHV